MARDVQTKVTVGAETKGFVKVAQEAAKITKAAASAAKDQLKNTKDVEKELGRLQGRLKDVARNQISLNKEMGKVKEGTKLYKELSNELRDLNRQQSNLERSAKGVERAFKSQAQTAAVTAAQMARGGLVQGLIQGAVPGAGPFLQRGPGMGRQVAGMAIGRGVRGMAGAAAAAPFGGLSAVAQGLMHLPGGAVLAQPLMQATRQAGMALQFRGGMQQAMPFLGTEQMQKATRGRVGRATRGFSREDIDVEAFERVSGKYFAPGTMRRSVGEGAQGISVQYLEEMLGADVYAGLIEQEKRKMGGERKRRVAGAMAPGRRARGTITEAGAGLAGMAKPEAFQFAAQIARVGGGRALEMPREFFRTAFAAKTLYGAGPEVTGAFMQAERRGGLVGGIGRGGDAMAEAIGQATAMGLEGSEINDFLNTIASGIQGWKSTGIPISAQSVSGIAIGVGASIGAVRGMAVARSIAGAAQGLAAGGPQQDIDMLMMQAVGYRGGGAEEFERAQIALEKGKFGAKETGQLMERLTAMGGGGASGRMYARTMLGKKGIRIGPSEMQKIGREGIAERPESGVLTGKELAERAAAAVDPAVARQARITNKQIESGGRLLKATQDMEEVAANISDTFTKELGPLIGDLTGYFKELSEVLPGAVKTIKAVAGGGGWEGHTVAGGYQKLGEFLGIGDGE